MAQRGSGYERIAGDAYWTPQWVYDALFEVEELEVVADPAPRDAKFDFLMDLVWIGDIVTNPPFSQAQAFIEHAIELTKPHSGKVAMLLPIAFDAAKTRRHLWHLPFKAKYTLTKRIRWENLEQRKAGPSTNHAWYVWDWKYIGPPKMGWLPLELAA